MPHLGHQYYREIGAGFPLVLIHGHTLDGRMWDTVAQHLAARYRVIVPDMAGHGQSGLAEQPAPLSHDLAALLDGLGIERAAVCGLSLGGAVAINFALHFPERCAALVPVDAALFGYKFAQWNSNRPYVAMAREQGLAPALEAWLRDPIFAPLMASPAGERLAAQVRAFSGATWLGSAGPVVPPGPLDAARLADVLAPALVLVGELDLPDFHTIAGLLAAGIPGARLTVVPGAGHVLPAEAPEAFLAALEPFLEQVIGA